MGFCKDIYTSWTSHNAKKPLPAFKRLLARCCMAETLVADIFAHLAESRFESISQELQRFLGHLSCSLATTALNEDCFQRCEAAERKVPTRRLSGDAAWSVPIGKRLLSEVYSFPEIDIPSCPAPGKNEKLPSSVYHSKRREAMPELLGGILLVDVMWSTIGVHSLFSHN